MLLSLDHCYNRMQIHHFDSYIVFFLCRYRKSKRMYVQRESNVECTDTKLQHKFYRSNCPRLISLELTKLNRVHEHKHQQMNYSQVSHYYFSMDRRHFSSNDLSTKQQLDEDPSRSIRDMEVQTFSFATRIRWRILLEPCILCVSIAYADSTQNIVYLEKSIEIQWNQISPFDKLTEFLFYSNEFLSFNELILIDAITKHFRIGFDLLSCDWTRKNASD